MKYKIVFFLGLFCFVKTYSQRRTYRRRVVHPAFSSHALFFSVSPNWDNNAAAIIKSQFVETDSAYYYKKRRNNKDSNLVMTQYFDTLGNVVERDEFNLKGEVFKITNYTFKNGILAQKETMSSEMIVLNHGVVLKTITDYEYDNSGNVITENESSFSTDSLKLLSTTILNREYDNDGQVIKEFITLPGAKTFLHHTFNYVNGGLSEMKTYDINHKLLFSYVYEYDAVEKVKSVYLYNGVKSLKHEYFYDNQNLTVREKDYEQPRSSLDHFTQDYNYQSNGLLDSQSLEDVRAENYYYKHFYTKQTQ